MFSDDVMAARHTSGLFASVRLTARTAWDVALDLIFPPRCAGCGRVDTLWCATCLAELAAVPLQIHTASLEHFVETASTGLHDGRLRDAVHALKYNTPAIGLPLGERLAAAVLQLNWSFDLIIPVPLHASRMQERGYNQSQTLCEAVAQQTGIAHHPHALLRFRDTGHQVGLNREERQTNVAEAFQAQGELVAQKRLLLIDDVRTTGATMSACAQAALQAGAAAVYGLTVTEARG
jgi:ComF family protein